jgi:hypothetical protein
MRVTHQHFVSMQDADVTVLQDRVVSFESLPKFNKGWFHFQLRITLWK